MVTQTAYPSATNVLGILSNCGLLLAVCCIVLALVGWGQEYSCVAISHTASPVFPTFLPAGKAGCTTFSFSSKTSYTGSKEALWHYEPIEKSNKKVAVIRNQQHQQLPASGFGYLKLPLSDGSFVLHKVWHVPKLQATFLSLGALTKDLDCYSFSLLRKPCGATHLQFTGHHKRPTRDKKIMVLKSTTPSVLLQPPDHRFPDEAHRSSRRHTPTQRALQNRTAAGLRRDRLMQRLPQMTKHQRWLEA